MSLAAGTRLGPYKILGPLGSGGMGEVYRARDPRLEREVAVKVLPPESSADSDLLRRFEQESKAAGAINHPNLLAVFDTGVHDGAPYIVFELLHGETLRERLKSPLPIRKAVDLAVQIAHGLAAAHAAGIVHRDLKPENVFVTVDGRVKILDFGLAKLEPRGVQHVSDSDTAVQLTEVGTVLGTAGYMSPEQVQGQPADHRSDVFSFGAVFHEMLSGRRAFHRDSAIETMRAILKEDPEIGEANRNIPAAIERIVRRCLEKRAEERFHSAHDLGLALEAVSVSTGGSTSGLPPIMDSRRWRAPGWAVAAVLVLLVVASAVAFLLGENWTPQTVPQFRRITFRRGSPGWARFSSDGQTVLYSAKWVDQPLQVFSARLDAIESRALGLNGSLAATKGGEMAVVLPNGTLARLPLDGGVPREIASQVAEADWAPDGNLAIIRDSGRRRIEFPPGHVLYESGGRISGLRVSPQGDRVAFIEIGRTQHRVSNIAAEAAGSVVVMDRQGQRTTLSTGWTSIGGLAWAPAGREVWFTATKVGISQALHAVTLAGRERLIARSAGILWLHDIFPDGRVLLTQGRASIEARGRMGQDTAEREYSWLDGTLGAIFSPDGHSFIFSEAADGGGPASGAYLRHADGSPPVRLGDGWALTISPDGKWVVCSNIGLPRELRLVPTGAGDPHTLRRGTISEYDWAYFLPDGKRLVVAGSEARRPPRLFVQELPEGEPKPFTPEGTGLEPLPAAITPDGRFVAAVPLMGEGRFALYPIDGGVPRAIPGIAPGDTPLRFSPDGASVYVLELSESGNRVVRLDLATGRKSRWLTLAPPDAAGFWGSTSFVDVAPDGHSYLYSYWRIVSDLFVVEGLR